MNITREVKCVLFSFVDFLYKERKRFIFTTVTLYRHTTPFLTFFLSCMFIAVEITFSIMRNYTIVAENRKMLFGLL